MGIAHKVKPEISEFIIQTRRNSPKLGCRSLAELVYEKFRIDLSKSSINTILKEAGLSIPIGRPAKRGQKKAPTPIKSIIQAAAESVLTLYFPKEIGVPTLQESILQPQALTPAQAQTDSLAEERETSGVIILQAVDYLLGGTHYITETIREKLKSQEGLELLAKTEALLYAPLAGDKQRFSAAEMDLYLKELEQVKALDSTVFPEIVKIKFCQETKVIQLTLSDKTQFYLDAQMQTIWLSQEIPPDFSAPNFYLSNYLKQSLCKEGPYIFLTAPGYETPSKDFFDFILSLAAKEKRISRFTLYNHKLEELETMNLEPVNRQFFLCALWPWQFSQLRKIELSGGFAPFHFAPLDQDFLLAEAEVTIRQPDTNQALKLRGVALKRDPAGKIEFIILTNFPAEKANREELSSLYLSRWPEPQEALANFSHKIELFTYIASSRYSLSIPDLVQSKAAPAGIKDLFNYYLKCLDLYARRYILPQGYSDQEFDFLKKHFYDLKVTLRDRKDWLEATFQVPANYPCLSDLRYACLRLNEREIRLSEKRAWFVI